MTREKALEEFNEYVELSNDGWKIKQRELRQIINEIYDSFESRTCENCKYFQINKQPYGDGFCLNEDIGVYDAIENELIYLDVYKDFGCNKFEEKDK